MDEAGQRVLPDAQAGLFSTLRPYRNFESIYQGQAGSVPIMFTQDGVQFDPMAGKPGYAPDLLQGLPVPLGARVLIWLPISSPIILPEVYNWLFIWRVRSVADFREARKAFHYPKQGPGVVTTVGPSPGPRFIMPCCYQSVVYADPGPVTMDPLGGVATSPVTRPARARVGAEQHQPQRSASSGFGFLPIDFPINGTIQQGITDSYVVSRGDFGLPTFFAVDVTAMGDELLVACTKDEPMSSSGFPPSGNASIFWDFNNLDIDLKFSLFFGQGGTVSTVVPLSDIGVYVTIVSSS